MKKVLITGCAGLIGSALAKRLYKEGYELTLVDDLSHGYEDNLKVGEKYPGEFHKLDIRSREIFPLFKGIDTVFHMAAISSLPECQSNPGDAMSNNVEGTANVLEASRRAKVRRIVFASTSAIYENNTKFPCEENDDVNPHITYSLSKWQAEKLCFAFIKNYGMEIVITRYYNVYGPNMDVKRKNPPFVAYAIKSALEKSAPVFHSDGKQERDYVYLDDVNELNILCMNKSEAAGQVFNVASGKVYSVKDIYKIVKNMILGAPEPIYREAGKLWEKYPELQEGFSLNEEILINEVNKFTLGSVEKSKKMLGWEAKVGIEEGMRNTIEYYKQLIGGA